MSDHPNGNSTPGVFDAPRDERIASSGQAASRRTFLKSGAGFVAGGLATQAPPDSALAQDAPDAELSRLQGQRRILIKGAVVLTQDRQVGDFARADILIEDGKIREIRPDIAASDTVAVDANNRIAIPGVVATHRHAFPGLLRGTCRTGRLDGPRVSYDPPPGPAGPRNRRHGAPIPAGRADAGGSRLRR